MKPRTRKTLHSGLTLAIAGPIQHTAYTAGVFHFLSARTWEQTFTSAGLTVTNSFRITPFVTTFVLKRLAVEEIP